MTKQYTVTKTSLKKKTKDKIRFDLHLKADNAELVVEDVYYLVGGTISIPRIKGLKIELTKQCEKEIISQVKKQLDSAINEYESKGFQELSKLQEDILEKKYKKGI